MNNQKFEGGSSEAKAIDVTSEFMTGAIEFMEFLSEHKDVRTAPTLEIHIDLTNITDREEFKAQARRVKAFIEELGKQERNASMRCTEEQSNWERNVFSSGVKWEKAE